MTPVKLMFLFSSGWSPRRKRVALVSINQEQWKLCDDDGSLRESNVFVETTHFFVACLLSYDEVR